MYRTQNAVVGLLVLGLHSIVKASPYNGPTPTPTFSGLRDSNQVDFGILPTANPWNPSELLKRLSGDPAVCGWVDGDSNNIVSCQSGYTCAATLTYVGCCSKGGLGCQALYTTCYDTLGPTCNGSCSANSAALICEPEVPYCATYNYASGSTGFGCAVVTGYNHTVLTSPTNGGPTPFGASSATATPPSSPITTSSSSISYSTTVGATPTPTPTWAATHTSSLSGGVIAGIAVGAALVIGLLAVIIWARMRRQRIKRQDAQAQRSSNTPTYHQGGFMYPQDPKSEPGLFSPPTSPPLFSRNHSDQYGFSSPPQSEQGKLPYSPESVRNSPRPSPNPPFAIPEMSELGQPIPVELPTGDEEQVFDKKHVPREI